MKLKNLVSLLVFLAMFSTTYVLAEEPTEEWVRIYDSGGYDTSVGIAKDSSGNIYVTGNSSNSDGTNDYMTIKYDANGNMLWSRRYDGDDWDNPTALAVDSSGNVYITGYSTNASIGTSDYITIKYDTNGNELWARRYGGYYWEYAFALAIDVYGNVYTAGGINCSYGTIKYDAAGNQLWVKEYSTGGCLSVFAIAVDLSSNVYVTGNGFTIKYDTNGNELWTKTYGEGASAITVDSTGNVYVTGYYVTIKYDTNGNELWTKRYDSCDWCYATAIAVDAAGNVYVTGNSSSDYTTIKYDTNGNELWIKRYDGGFWDYATAITIDASDNIYVTGGSSNDYATIKYDANGNELWVKRYDSCFYDYASDIAMDFSGNIYVTGYSYNGSGSSDYATIKYSPVKDGAPSAPRDLTATAISQSQINLSWADNSNNEDGFKVERATMSGGSYTLIATLPADSTTFQDTGLLPGTAYYYKVRAFNANGNSGYANVSGYTGCGILYEASATTPKYDACSLSDIIRSMGIKNKGIETSLVSLAENACRQITNGKTIPGKNMLEALLKEILAQEGKNIDTISTDKLINYISNVIAGL